MRKDQFASRIEYLLNSARYSMAYAAPELQDLHWDVLKSELTNFMYETFNNINEKVHAECKIMMVDEVPLKFDDYE